MADADTLDTIMARDAALLTDTVREAGALALSLFRTELKNWTKGASSPVSEADIAANDLIESRLRSATPDYGWLSEESVDDEARLGKPLVWIVDPIDGTARIWPAVTTGALAWPWSKALRLKALRRCWRRCSRRSPRSFSLPRAAAARFATIGRFMQPRGQSWISPAWLVRNRWSSG